MPDDLHLISHHLCPYVQRAAIVLLEKNIPFERTNIDLANKPAWFLDLSPLGRVPVLQTKDAVIFESQVIAEYIDEATSGSLHPSDILEKAKHRSWIEFGSETLNIIGGFYNAPDADTFETKRIALRQKFDRIEPEVTTPFFSGESFYMIDGVWGTIFRYFDTFDQIADFGIMNNLENVRAWRTMLAQRPSISNAPPIAYPERLHTFLRSRNSYLSTLMKAAK